MLSTNVKFLRRILFAVDLFIIVGLCFAVCGLSGEDNPMFTAVYFSVVLIFLFSLFDMYAFKRKKVLEDIVSVCLSVFAADILYIVLGLVFKEYADGFIHIIAISSGNLLFLSVWRTVFDRLYLRLISNNKTLIIESNLIPTRLARKLKYSFAKPENVRYYIVDENNEQDINSVYSQIDGEYANIILSDGLNETFKEALMNYAICKNKCVSTIATFTKASVMNGYIKLYHDTPFISASPINLSKAQLFIKRTFDIICSVLLIILSSPFMAVCAIAIKADSDGPAIYKQERYTINKKVFNCYKFRTMHIDAEKNGAQLSTKNDPRLTRVGKIIRKTRLDELPQLFNVLKGDMSFVGPRPERPIFADMFCENVKNYSMRYKIKAGITGYAQVYGNYSSRASDKILLDLIYALNYSFLLDIKLILLTIRQIFIHDSAEGDDIEFEEEMSSAERELIRRKNPEGEIANNEKNFDYNCSV